MLRLVSKFCTYFCLFVLVLIVGDILLHGYQALNIDFLTSLPEKAGREGGIFPTIINTLLLSLISMLIVIPFGLSTALYLTRVRNKLSESISFLIDILSGIPSIVFGLFGSVFFAEYLDLGFSILSGGLTLGLMSLPLFIKMSLSGMKSIPIHQINSAKSLGLSDQTIASRIILPASLTHIILGLILSLGRSLSETAALIFTSGYVNKVPTSILDSGRSLSIHIYDLAMNVPGGNINSYKSAFVLILIILILNGALALLLRKLNERKYTL